jgi:cytochrome c551/c552
VQRGCVGCHTLEGVPGAVGKVGPELTHVATNAATREPGKDAEAYIRESISNPTAFTVPGFPTGVMPPNLVTGKDLDDVVAFLLQHK